MSRKMRVGLPKKRAVRPATFSTPAAETMPLAAELCFELGLAEMGSLVGAGAPILKQACGHLKVVTVIRSKVSFF